MPNLFISLTLVLASALSANSGIACPGGVLNFHDVTVNSDGVITRAVTARVGNDSQNEKYIYKIRDVLKLEQGDEVTLNAGLQFVDASAYIKLKRKEQDRDAKGIFSTTFEVRETMVSNLMGTEQVSEKSYLAKIVTNYAGNGKYTKGCGEVLKTALTPSAE